MATVIHAAGNAIAKYSHVKLQRDAIGRALCKMVLCGSISWNCSDAMMRLGLQVCGVGGGGVVLQLLLLTFSIAGCDFSLRLPLTTASALANGAR